jgi:cytidylate kinase
MIITVSGVPGAGATTVSEHLAKKLRYKLVTVGELHKRLAEEEGIPSAEFEKAWIRGMKSPHEWKLFHNRLDQMQKELARKQKNLIVNGKLSAFQIPWAHLKILLVAPLEVRAKRIAGREGITKARALKSIREREELERKEWRNIYGFDYVQDKDVYDFVINTSHWSSEHIAELVEKMVSLRVRK